MLKSVAVALLLCSSLAACVKVSEEPAQPSSNQTLSAQPPFAEPAKINCGPDEVKFYVSYVFARPIKGVSSNYVCAAANSARSEAGIRELEHRIEKKSSLKGITLTMILQLDD